MKRLEKSTFQSDKDFINKIFVELGKEKQIELELNYIPFLISYIKVFKVTTIKFSIHINSSSKYCVLTLLTPFDINEPLLNLDTQKEITFAPFDLKCYNVMCIDNKCQHKDKQTYYSCTKEIRYKNCTNKLLMPIP